MQKRVSEDIVRCEKALVEKLQPIFIQQNSAPNGDSDCWAALGSFLEWQMLPSILQLAPAWPHHLVWCDGVDFFYGHVKQPNALYALGCSWWLPCDQSLPDDAETGGIAHAELIEVEMHLLEEGIAPHVDYTIKIWANNLCHFLTPTKISVAPSCSDVASTPDFTCLLETIKKTPHVSNRRSITSLLGGLGSKGRALLEELLNDADVIIRRAAADGLARQKLTSEFAVPLIAKALQDTDLEVQHLTANVLWRRAQTDSAFLPLLHQSTPVLLQIFGHEPKIHRHFYINEILTFLGKSEPSVVEAMTEFLANENLQLRATKILWDINLPTAEMLAIYQTALESENIRWRVAATFSLWFFDIDGGKAFIHATEDEAILQEPSDLAGLLAYRYNSALKLMPTETAIPVLTSILQRRKTHVRLWCQTAFTLANLYSRETDNASQQLLQSLVPELMEYLKSDNEVVQRYAIRALGAIGENANAASLF
jgi:HEAT repeat protein